MPVIFPILFETKASLGLLEWTNGAEQLRAPHVAIPGMARLGPEPGNPRLLQGAGGTTASRPTAPTPPSSAWRPCGRAGGTEELSPPASKRHPPCSGGTSIAGTVGWPAWDPPVSPRRDATSHRPMDTCAATAATSRASLPFAPQLSEKGAGKALANTGFP